MSRFTPFCLYLLLCLGQAAAQPFVVEPYLQMGDAPGISSSDSMVIQWHSADTDQHWDVQVKKPD